MGKKKRIGILTAGGDCPGLNAAIRGVGKAAILRYGWEVYGFSSGYLGLINGEYKALDERSLSGILTVGGTILGTSREKPFRKGEYDEFVMSKPERIRRTYDKIGLDCLVCMGGNGTMKTASRLSEMGLNVVGVPKTIDNDVWGTDLTFGFDSAASIATEAIDRLHTTANSHKRIMVVQVMGHSAGWLTLYAGVAGGGDIILLPEIPYDLDAIAREVEKRSLEGKPYSIIVVAEGIGLPPKKKTGTPRIVPPAAYIANQVRKRTDLECRETILGYIQRGGSPSARDRVVATELGAYTAHLVALGEYGSMSAYRGGELVSVPLSEVAGKVKTVPLDHHLIAHARSLGTTFGD